MAGRSGRRVDLEFTSDLATAFEIMAPGRVVLEFTAGLAGRGGRTCHLEFTARMATAFVEEGAPGTQDLEFSARLAGRGGRNANLEFMAELATAFGIGAPGKRPLEFTACVATAFGIRAPGRRDLEFTTTKAGRGGRSADMEFNNGLATAFVKFIVSSRCLQLAARHVQRR